MRTSHEHQSIDHGSNNLQPNGIRRPMMPAFLAGGYQPHRT